MLRVFFLERRLHVIGAVGVHAFLLLGFCGGTRVVPFLGFLGCLTLFIHGPPPKKSPSLHYVTLSSVHYVKSKVRPLSEGQRTFGSRGRKKGAPPIIRFGEPIQVSALNNNGHVKTSTRLLMAFKGHIECTR